MLAILSVFGPIISGRIYILKENEYNLERLNLIQGTEKEREIIHFYKDGIIILAIWKIYNLLTIQLLLQLPSSVHGEGNGTPLQYSCLENPMDGETWLAAVHGVAQSPIRLKRLSNSSSSSAQPHFSLDQLLLI